MKIRSIFAYTLLLSTATMAMDAPAGLNGSSQGNLDRENLQALITQTFGTNRQDFDQLYQRFQGNSERIWSFMENERETGTTSVQCLVRDIDNLHLPQDADLEAQQKQITANHEKAEDELLKGKTELQKVSDTIAQYTAQIEEQEQLLKDIYAKNFPRLKKDNELQIRNLRNELKEAEELYSETARQRSHFRSCLIRSKSNIAGHESLIRSYEESITRFRSQIERYHTKNSEYHQQILSAIRQSQSYSFYEKWQEQNRQEISKLQQQIATKREEISRLQQDITSEQEDIKTYSTLVESVDQELELIYNQISQARQKIKQYQNEIDSVNPPPVYFNEDAETVKKIRTSIAQLQQAIEQQGTVKNKIERTIMATHATITNLQAQRAELTQQIHQARTATNERVLRLLREQIVADEREDTAMLNRLIDSHIAEIQDYRQPAETIARELSTAINQQRQQQRLEAAAAEAKRQQEIQQQQAFKDNAFEALKTGNLEAFMANFQGLTSKTVHNPEGYRLIHVAAEYGRVREAQEIAKHAVSLERLVNVELRNGSTSLHLAAGAGHTEFVQFLLSNGADILKVTPTGVTILEMALNYLEGRLDEDDTAGIENGHKLINIIEEAITKATEDTPFSSSASSLQGLKRAVISVMRRIKSKPATNANERLLEELKRLFSSLRDINDKIVAKERKRMEEEERKSKLHYRSMLNFN
ncbi:ankyrin repeat domain-containing protein [Candidatus Odyssella thessalonicensis]|uniref:ankyrin repeat domain-containing protein n=1 Tax=Candidatus Odyssella thessalonicensis TaxID=84647 RepID=UPI000225ABC4|nr:ankyrin repeat domain-containing protein [Candidatus Odyssella thessalonicensis]